MDFATLKTRVQARIVDITASITVEVDELVNRAVRDAQRKHNYSIMRAEVEYATTIASHRLPDAGTSVPDDWKESRARPYRREGETGSLGVRLIEWARSEEDILKLYAPDDPNQIGAPTHVLEAIDDLTFEVYPFPDGQSQWNDGEHRVVLPYWKFFPELSDDSDTNWFTENMEQYIIEEATGNGFLLNWDEERAALHLAIAKQKRIEAQNEDKRKRLVRGLTMVPKMDVHAPTTYRRF